MHPNIKFSPKISWIGKVVFSWLSIIHIFLGPLPPPLIEMFMGGAKKMFALREIFAIWPPFTKNLVACLYGLFHVVLGFFSIILSSMCHFQFYCLKQNKKFCRFFYIGWFSQFMGYYFLNFTFLILNKIGSNQRIFHKFWLKVKKGPSCSSVRP